MLEKTLEGSLYFKEIQPVHPKGTLPQIVIGRTDVEAETPILWPPDVKSLRLPFSSPGDLPNPGIEPGSPALQADSLLTELQGKAMNSLTLNTLRNLHELYL